MRKDRHAQVLALQDRISALELQQIDHLQKENERPEGGTGLDLLASENSAAVNQASEKSLLQLRAAHEQQCAAWQQERATLEQELRQARQQASLHAETTTMPAAAHDAMDGKLRQQLGKKDKVIRTLSEAIKTLGTSKHLPRLPSDAFGLPVPAAAATVRHQ